MEQIRLDPAEQRSRLTIPATEAAPWLLGAVLRRESEEGDVAVRITEVEAYLGAADPGSHAFRGKSARNSTMFGPAGHLYVYFTYGMHYCANVVCGEPGQATGLLLRAGEIVEGHAVAGVRRKQPKSPLDLARGPARLTQALGIDRSLDGADVFTSPLRLELPPEPAAAEAISCGPRVGVSGEGGGEAYPWRFWLTGEPSVSKYRPAVQRARVRASGATAKRA
ncbi:DNA-3-methyladenine glycosylase [Arthrobacter sp. Sa2BUA2]|uniref:Putative 3-methyladenine DNA glycosylase n=1 Tax=Arthrobacter pullicola TaxID=2762224 RepID=A0ABR8YFG0_9MICC|nr:DNA-3-methyladenine glycosylase [Arthrobacter pullicola]MBD8042851.1 DNA-3-methyladenine glycosylase [Arthrobacter pullicola]